MTVTYFPGRRAVQDDMPDERVHRRELARATNSLMQGHSNATLQVTLDSGVGSTTINDSRISAQTAVVLAPCTANAAAEIAGGSLYVTPSNGQAVITHANNAKTDRTFIGVLLG